MLGLLPFVEDPDLSVSAARALAQLLPPWYCDIDIFKNHLINIDILQKWRYIARYISYRYIEYIEQGYLPKTHYKSSNNKRFLPVKSFLAIKVMAINIACDTLPVAKFYTINNVQTY